MGSKLTAGRGGIRFAQLGKTAISGLKSIKDPKSIRPPLYIKLKVSDTSKEKMRLNVSVGDRILRGSLIASPESEHGTPIYSGIAGTVTAVTEEKLSDGGTAVFVTVSSDGTLAPVSPKPYDGRLADSDPDMLIALARRAGIICRDGMPLWLKMEESRDTNCVIINAAASFYDDRVFSEMISAYPERFICGIKIILKTVGQRHAYIALSEFMTKEYALLTRKIEDFGDEELLSLVSVPDYYPMHHDASIVAAMDLEEHTAIFDALSCIDLFAAFSEGYPITDTAVTVCGDAVQTPQTLIIPVGTEISSLAQYCGGFRERAVRIIKGNPMNGTVCSDGDCVDQSTFVIRFDSTAEKRKEYGCIRCGKCISVCPSKLAPLYLSKYVKSKKLYKCVKYGISACIDCGCCSFVCPSGIPLAKNIRLGKQMLYESLGVKSEKDSDKKEGRHTDDR